jgi:hypothetical protein
MLYVWDTTKPDRFPNSFAGEFSKSSRASRVVTLPGLAVSDLLDGLILAFPDHTTNKE